MKAKPNPTPVKILNGIVGSGGITFSYTVAKVNFTVGIGEPLALLTT